MTDYVKSTAFASKDALSTGNPLKIVKGTEIDTEFNNIATAVATKSDINSPAFSGTPTAPTASANTSNTQIASTAFVQAAIALLYPVGSIYTNASVATNPGTLLGFGTWTAFGAGRVMVGFNSSNALFDTAEETGGSADAITVSHTHTASSSVSDPGHAHTYERPQGQVGYTQGGSQSVPYPQSVSTSTASTGITVATTVASTGSSGTNANYQPYITVYMWKRTA
jgi:hypothetical protein